LLGFTTVQHSACLANAMTLAIAQKLISITFYQ